MWQDLGTVDVDFVFTSTSSPKTVTPSVLAHFPILEFQPTMVDLTQAWSLTWELANNTDLWILAPSPTTTFGPMVTFGPIKADGWILAVGSINTLPPWTYFSLHNFSGCFSTMTSSTNRFQKGNPLVDRRPSSNPQVEGVQLFCSTKIGKVSFSIEVGLISIKSMTDGFKMYKPALILLPTNSTGFRRICRSSLECLCRGQ